MEHERLIEADGQGRLSLGRSYAHNRFLVRDDDGYLMLTKAVVIGEHEAQLLRNPKVRDAIEEGLADAKAGRTQRNAVDLDKYES